METQHTTYTGVITEDLFPPAPADSARRGTCPSRSQHTPQTNTISPESPWRGAPQPTSRPPRRVRVHIPGTSTSRARPRPGRVHIPGASTSQARPRPGRVHVPSTSTSRRVHVPGQASGPEQRIPNTDTTDLARRCSLTARFRPGPGALRQRPSSMPGMVLEYATLTSLYVDPSTVGQIIWTSFRGSKQVNR